MLADHGLQHEIDSIQAVDEHAHPLPLGLEPAGDPRRPIQPYDYPLPLRMRPSNPEYLDAWAALWGYEHRDWDVGHLADLMAKKQAVIAAQGQSYNVWVLDQLRIQTMIGIAYAPSATEPPPRFRWCAFADWLLWPFPCDPAPDSALINLFLATMGRMRGTVQCDDVPPDLDGFVARVMLPVLELYKRQDSVGIKFQTPYYRPLDFDDVPHADAAALYTRGVQKGSLGRREHKALQDYLFRKLVAEAGMLGFVVQMHTGLGVKPNFDIAGSNPLLMEPVFHAATGTKFVMLHGGWPFDKETVSLMAHSNVYTDFSCANIYQYPRSLSNQIRAALEWFPEKILYGTDAYSDRSIAMLSGVAVRSNPLAGWEEKAWLMDRAGRQALGLALSGMLGDGIVDAGRASELAGMVMRENATSLYRLNS